MRTRTEELLARGYSPKRYWDRAYREWLTWYRDLMMQPNPIIDEMDFCSVDLDERQIPIRTGLPGVLFNGEERSWADPL